MRRILRRRELVVDDWQDYVVPVAGAAATANGVPAEGVPAAGAPAAGDARPEASSTAGSVPDSHPLIIPFAELRRDPRRWHRRRGPLGVRLAPGDPVEELAPELGKLSLVAVEFPNPSDGRGYSLGRLLRERLGFTGELRAVGAGVRQDQVFLLARCGFDALELAPGEDPQAALRALQRYDVAYQPGAPEVAVHRQRFLPG